MFSSLTPNCVVEAHPLGVVGFLPASTPKKVSLDRPWVHTIAACMLFYIGWGVKHDFITPCIGKTTRHQSGSREWKSHVHMGSSQVLLDSMDSSVYIVPGSLM